MKQENLPKGFSPFSWAIAWFCSPILLWPLALLLSPSILENPKLSHNQSVMLACFFWFYPFVLAILARLLFKFHQRNEKMAKYGLFSLNILFWMTATIVIKMGLN